MLQKIVSEPDCRLLVVIIPTDLFCHSPENGSRVS